MKVWIYVEGKSDVGALSALWGNCKKKSEYLMWTATWHAFMPVR